MQFTPVRRLAAGATASALLATALLVPAALAAAADDLPGDAPILAAASGDTTVASSPDQPGEPAHEAPAGQPGAETAALAAEPAGDAPVAEPAPAPADAAVPRSVAATTASAPSAPRATLADEAYIAAGDTWVGTFAVDDANYVRLVALGSRFEVTMTDEAGNTSGATAANGYVDVGVYGGVADGDITVAIHNTASTPQEIPYAFGWDTRDIRAVATASTGSPVLSVSVYPTRGTTQLTASAVTRIIHADGTEQVKSLTGSAGFYTASIAGLAPGRYLLEVDTLVLGVHRYAVRTVTVAAAETTPPTVTVTAAQQPGAGGWYAGAVDVTLTASDAGAGVHFLSWGVDTSTLDYTTADSKSVRITGEGTHQLRYQAEDWQGNKSAIATRQYNIDHSMPNVTLNGFAEGQEFAQDELVAIEYLCEDAVSGIQSCVGDIGSGDFLDTSTPGTHTFRVTATDKAGIERIVERSYTVLAPDTTDPEIVVDVPAEPASGWYLDTVTVRFTASDESGIRRIHYEYDTNQGTVRRDIEAGTAEVTFDRSQYYTLSYWAEDNAGNRSESQDLHLYVDATAPWVNMISPADEPSILPNGHYAQNERVVIDFSCDDDASGVASCEGSTPDGELLPTGTPGTHELRIVVTDVAGHRTERIVTYTVDAAPTQGGGSNGGVVRPGAQGGLASTGAQDVVPAIALAMLLLGAGAALVIRRRVRTR